MEIAEKTILKIAGFYMNYWAVNIIPNHTIIHQWSIAVLTS